jgi:pyruvate dehydrogenase E2 component (dihydrolipoamide acetyltransferase)
MSHQSVEIKLPWIAPDDPEIEVIRWLIEPGQSIEIDQDILVLSVEGEEFILPSPVDGVVGELSVEPGDWLSEGQVLAIQVVVLFVHSRS